MMAIAPFGAAVPKDVRALVTAAADKVEHGFNPFTGPITDNTGVVRIPAGESWGGDKMGNFDWYVEGVIGKAEISEQASAGSAGGLSSNKPHTPLAW